MPARIRIDRRLFAFLIFAVSTISVPGQLRWDEESARFPLYSRLLQRYKAIKPELEKPGLADEQKLQLHSQLLEIRFQAQSQHINASTTPGTSEELKERLRLLISALTNEIAKVRSTLDPKPTPSPVEAVSDRDRLPVPKFESARASQAAEAFRNAMLNMREHLCRKDDRPTEEWRSRFDELLLAMIVAEHRLVWSAGIEFENEAEIRRALPVELENIRGLLGNAYNNARDNARLRAQLGEIIRETDAVRTALESAARSADGSNALLLVFARVSYLNRVDARITPENLPVFGIDGTTYARLRGRAMGALAGVRSALYRKAIDDINRRTPSGEKFVLHFDPRETSTSTARRALNDAYGSLVKQSGSLGIFLELGADVSSMQFDEAAQKSLRGDCAQSQLITIYFNPGREKDAAAAEKVLTANGFRVNSFEDLNTARESGKIWFDSSGTEIEARRVAELISGIEPISNFVREAGDISGSYAVALIAKKREPVDPLRPVTGVWHFRLNCSEPNPKCEGYMILPRGSSTWNIYSLDRSESNLFDPGSMKLDGDRFSARGAWWWTRDSFQVSGSPGEDGLFNSMHGTWTDPAYERNWSVTMTRVRPTARFAKFTKLSENFVAVDFEGEFLPIDPRIGGGIVHLDMGGMKVMRWYRLGESNVMRVEIQHEGTKPGSKYIWLNGVPVTWEFRN